MKPIDCYGYETVSHVMILKAQTDKTFTIPAKHHFYYNTEYFGRNNELTSFILLKMNVSVILYFFSLRPPTY